MKCEFCTKEERKATLKNLKGITWLCPDEKFICDSCLRSKMSHVIMTG